MKINLAFGVNQNYLQHLAVCLVSILEKNSDVFLMFF